LIIAARILLRGTIDFSMSCDQAVFIGLEVDFINAESAPVAVLVENIIGEIAELFFICLRFRD